MFKKFICIFTSAAACALIAEYPLTVNAATPEEAAELARSMGIPESLIQAGWNKYYEDPDMYPPELIDSYMDTLRNMNQEMIEQLIGENIGTIEPSSPAVTTAVPSTSDESTTTAAASADADKDNSSSAGNSGDSSETNHITITLPNGSTFDRISSKEFAAMTLDEKRAYMASLTPEQKTAFLENMSPEDYKSLLKQLPLDNKAEIIDGMADITSQLGLTLSVDELTDDNIILSMKDEDGKLVAQSAASDTVAATGYDRRGILALAAALTAFGICGTAFAIKKSFVKNEV